MKNVTKDPVQGKLGKVYMPDQQVCIVLCFWNNKKKVNIAFDMINDSCLSLNSGWKVDLIE
jgi:hypothetical protein